MSIRGVKSEQDSQTKRTRLKIEIQYSIKKKERMRGNWRKFFCQNEMAAAADLKL